MLVVGQEVLVIDEPTYGQDRANTEALMETMSELHESGWTVVVLSHDIRVVAEHADTGAVLVDGEIQFCGTSADLFDDRETLSVACLPRPPLAELTDRVPAFSGPATLERCYECSTSGRTELTARDHDDTITPAWDHGRGRPNHGEER